MTMGRVGTYLVTAAAGNVGSEVVTSLLASGARVRALLRPGTEARVPLGCQVAHGDLTQVADVAEAARDTDGVFLLAGYDGIDRALGAMTRGGVQRAVLMSTVAAESRDMSNAISAFHVRSEDAVAESGMEWTFLRSYALMSNVSRWAGQLAHGDRVRLPFAEVPIALVDQADVAEVASICLTEPGHHRQAYALSGSTALLPAEQVETVAHAVGRTVQFEAVPAPVARAEMAETTPADVVAAFFRYYDNGEIDETTVVDTVQRLTGRAPTSLQDFLARPAVADRLARLTAPVNDRARGG